MDHCLEKSPKEEPGFAGSYRPFLSQESTADWLSPILQENKNVTNADFTSSRRELITLDIPDDAGILMPSPRLLLDTILVQYMQVRVLEDLLHAVALEFVVDLARFSRRPLVNEANWASPSQILLLEYTNQSPSSRYLALKR